MTQQTAVEWLIEQLAKKHNEFQALTFYYDHKDQIEQAKAMEKEQHSNTWDSSRLFDKGDDYIGEQKPFEQYYNETYESNT